MRKRPQQVLDLENCKFYKLYLKAIIFIQRITVIVSNSNKNNNNSYRYNNFQMSYIVVEFHITTISFTDDTLVRLSNPNSLFLSISLKIMKLTLIKTQLKQVYTAKYTGVYPYLKVDGERTFKYARTSGPTSFARIFGFAPLKTFGK